MLKIGAAVDHLPRAGYFETLPLAEVCLRPPLPRTATLKRLRHQSAGEAVLSLRLAPSLLRDHVGGARPDAELAATLEWTRRAADALQAEAVLVPTPAQLTPAARGRELLRVIVEELRADASQSVSPLVVWEPHGPWEPEAAVEQAAELSIVCAFDPLLTQRPPGPIGYARVQTLGEHSSLSDAALEQVLDDMLEGGPDGFVVVEGPRAFRLARRMGDLLQDVPPAAGGAG